MEQQLLEPGSEELPDEILTALDDAIDKLTHATDDKEDGAYLLDSEATYEQEDCERRPSLPQDQTKSSSSVPQPLEHHIYLSAGRSVVARPRAQYFPPVPELDEAEQQERTARSQEANLRKAIIRARDHAVAEDCGLWVSLTVDDLHEGQLTPESLSEFRKELSKRYGEETGRHLHYIGVIGTHGRGPHVHALFSRDLEPDIVRELWEFGSIDEIVEIHEDQIEQKVRYMADNIRVKRVTSGRFLRSRGPKEEKIVLSVRSGEEAREQLSDLIGPDKPRLLSAQPFGESPRYSFRFKPVRGERDG